MATRSKLAAVLNGLVQNVDLSGDQLVLDSVQVGGGSGTVLTKTILDGLIANSHAPSSDNQNIIAGDGLSGGGSGASVTLDVDATVVRTNGANDFTADQSMGGNKLTDLADPTSDQEAATKKYVDDSVSAATPSAADVSYVNTSSGLTATNVQDAIDEIDGRVDTIEGDYGVANGLATLDSGGKVPLTQLPNSIVQYIGTWNASTNTPVLSDYADGPSAAEHVGDVYKVTVAGTQDLGSGSITYGVGDYAILNSIGQWELAHAGADAVVSVNGQSGIVVLTTSNISEGSNLYYTDGRFDTRFASKSTSDLTEGSNLYFTDERAQDAIAAALTNSATIQFNYNDAGNQISADVLSAPLSMKSMVAGESFAANTSFLVRFALTGETAGRVYKADSAVASDKKYWALGLALSTSLVSAGQNINVVLLGTHTLGSSDTPFSSGDVGLPVWLTTSGGFSITAPTSSGTAAYKVGVVEATSKVFIDGKQLTGVN